MLRNLMLAPLVLLVAPVAEDPAGGGWADLKGKWVVESIEVDGNKFEPGALKFDTCTILAPKEGVEKGTDSVGWLVLFEGGRLFQEWPVSTLDPESEPKGLELQSRGPTILAEDQDGIYYHNGIYRLEGDELTVCLSKGRVDGRAKRPKAFDADAGTGRTKVVLKRRPAAK